MILWLIFSLYLVLGWGGAHIIRAKVSRVRVSSIISRTVLGTPVFILPICVTGVKRFHSFHGYFTKINRC